jgi:AraC-like DNA-binding protein
MLQVDKFDVTPRSFLLQWFRRSKNSLFVNKETPLGLSAFERVFASRRDDGFSQLGASVLALGCETRTVPSEYRWDGMRRADDPSHPHVVFQATLAGWGRFERGGRQWQVGPETGFFAVLPSKHVYSLPPESGRWSFFWLNSGHPWVVERIAQLSKLHPPVFKLPTACRLMVLSRAFFERVCQRRFEDAFAEEAALLEWTVEFERHLHDLAHPRGRSATMLDALRAYTLSNLRRPFGMEEYARRQGRSRSHFSHCFKQATGMAPAAYVLDVRLNEARARLRGTAEPLKEIAGATGFADANHFCKVFRRRYHISPGSYRRRLG